MPKVNKARMRATEKSHWHKLSAKKAVRVSLAEVALGQGPETAYEPERPTLQDLIHAIARAGKDRRHQFFSRLIKQVHAEQALRW